jgi:hypothetical protein
MKSDALTSAELRNRLHAVRPTTRLKGGWKHCGGSEPRSEPAQAILPRVQQFNEILTASRH